eukprot:TRINITY_DN9347_c0_g1_i1.p1 TRINITY_DN9347_c0_g1~~TRINITY_DN9347_c0_g1_i1.p1  ORF type:complete len:274 (+),score=37.91 TRINITY_DN9347_c0_g1_i1:25-846(+)
MPSASLLGQTDGRASSVASAAPSATLLEDGRCSTITASDVTGLGDDAAKKGSTKFTLSAIGPFPRVSNTHSQDDLRLLCYGTQSRRTYTQPALRSEHQAENMTAIYFMGKKRSRYMGVQERGVPNFGKASCNYSLEFKARGSFCKEDRQLAESFRGIARPASIGDFTPTTHSMRTYCDHGDERRSWALQKNAAPDIFHTKTTGGLGPMMETRSSTHVAHRASPADVTRSMQSGLQVRPNSLGVASSGVNVRTTVQADFTRPRHTAATRTISYS